MKRILLAIVFCMGCWPFLLFSQTAGAFQGQITVKQDSFVIKRNVLYLYMHISLSGLQVGRYESMVLTPLLHAGEKEFALKPIVLNGANKQKIYERKKVFDGPVYAKKNAYAVLKNNPDSEEEIVYLQEVECRDWMKEASLVLRGERCNYNGRPAQTYVDILTDKITIQ
ncbi:MAG: DUF3868 domain-containing protein [Parabacteroides sp.]|nr:DUF3868 domain-containing protein [Parabacteroides sp.]